VRLDGLRTDGQGGPDLIVRPALRDEPDDVVLTRRQPCRRPTRRTDREGQPASSHTPDGVD
jgi:hypothetical protein